MERDSAPVTWADVRRAVIWSGLREALGGAVRSRSLRVVDAGGGTGGFAVPLAEDGHRVLVIDPNANSLASLARRAAERGVSDRVTSRQADLISLPAIVGAGTVDLLLCHSVLEFVDAPVTALAAAITTLRTEGLLSVVAANRHAPVLARVLAGRFVEAEHALDDPAGRGGPAERARRFDPAELTAIVGACGADVIATHGVRIFTDILPGAVLDAAEPDAAARLLRLERAVADRPPFRDIAAHVHVLARRRVGGERGPGPRRARPDGHADEWAGR